MNENLELKHEKYDKEFNSCTFLQATYEVSNSLRDFAKQIKDQGVESVLYYHGFDADIKALDEVLDYKASGFDHLVLVYEKHSSFWEIKADSHTPPNICYKYAGKSDVALMRQAANLDTLKDRLFQLYTIAIKEYNNMPDKNFDFVSRADVIAWFKSAISVLENSKHNKSELFWHNGLKNSDMYRIIESLNEIPLTTVMGSFLDTFKKISDAHGQLVNDQYIALQQCINS